MDKDFERLINEAKRLAVKRRISEYAIVGHVGCALLTSKGNIYTGISTELKCNLGKCAEYGAIEEMIKNGESEIVKLVAFSSRGVIYAPCGSCREIIKMVNDKNLDTQIMIAENKVMKLKDLLPEMYQTKQDKNE